MSAQRRFRPRDTDREFTRIPETMQEDSAVVGVAWARLVVMPACVALVACGAARPAGGPVPAAPAPSIAVLDAPFGSDANGVRLLRTDGTQVAHVPLPETTEAIAIAGRRLLVAGGGRLEIVDAAGHAVDAGALGGDSPDAVVRGLVASPDGRTWTWSVVRQDTDGMVHSQLWLGGDSVTPRIVLERIERGSAEEPVAWTAAGPVVADQPLGIGGYVLFRRAFGPSFRLDIGAERLDPLTSGDCAFSDLGPTGAVACVVDGREGPNSGGRVTLRIIRRDAHEVDVPLEPAVAQAGAALFAPDGRTLSLAYSPILGSGAEEIATDLVDVSTGERHSLGYQGMTPVTWLPDGRLVTVRRSGVRGGLTGTYIVSTGGVATRISRSAEALGALH